jgi:hypothetical protein
VGKLRKEMASLINHKTSKLIKLLAGRKAIKIGWVDTAKKNAHGAIYHLETSVVAKEKHQTK